MSATLRQGDVVRYVPKSSWCHDGVAIAEQRGNRVVLVDTYWSYDAKVVRPDSYELLFNLGDYEEKPRHIWETFAPADRRYVGKQHNYCPTYFVRKGAVPSLATQIENARERVSDAESKVASAESSLRWARQELATLEAEAQS